MDEDIIALLIGIFFGIIFGLAIMYNGLLDTQGKVTKILPLDEKTEVIIIENVYEDEEVLLAPKDMMRLDREYSDIEFDKNHRVESVEIKEND